MLESVKKDKIVKNLKPRLLGTLVCIIAIDIAAVVFIFHEGIEFGTLAVLCTLFHVLISFELLVTLQKGIKRDTSSKFHRTVTVLSSVPQPLECSEDSKSHPIPN